MRAWLTLRLKEDESVVKLADIMPSQAASSDSGRYVYFDHESWPRLVDMDEFLKRLEAVRKAPGGQDPAFKAIFERFDRAIAYKERY